MEMQEAVKTYYHRLKEHISGAKGSLPRTGWDECWNQEIYTSGPDSNEKAAWKPMVTELPNDWKEIETKLGFMPSDRIKEYFFSCRFPRLSGRWNNIDIWFDSVGVRQSQEDGLVSSNKMAEGLPVNRAYVLGGADSEGNDEILLCYDEEKKKLFLLEIERNDPVYIEGTPADIISKMEPF